MGARFRIMSAGSAQAAAVAVGMAVRRARLRPQPGRVLRLRAGRIIQRGITGGDDGSAGRAPDFHLRYLRQFTMQAQHLSDVSGW